MQVHYMYLHTPEHVFSKGGGGGQIAPSAPPERNPANERNFKIWNFLYIHS